MKTEELEEYIRVNKNGRRVSIYNINKYDINKLLREHLEIKQEIEDNLKT